MIFDTLRSDLKMDLGVRRQSLSAGLYLSYVVSTAVPSCALHWSGHGPWCRVDALTFTLDSRPAQTCMFGYQWHVAELDDQQWTCSPRPAQALSDHALPVRRALSLPASLALYTWLTFSCRAALLFPTACYRGQQTVSCEDCRISG